MNITSFIQGRLLVPPIMHDYHSCKSYFRALNSFRGDRLGIITSGAVGAMAGSNIYTELRRNLFQNIFENPLLQRWMFITVMTTPIVSTLVRTLLNIVPNSDLTECERGVEEMGSYQAYIDSFLLQQTPLELDDL